MELSLELARFLSSFQDSESGALLDPLEQRPIDNSYGTAFFALLCALQYRPTKSSSKEQWKQRSIKALQYELSVARRYVRTAGVYRWEFKNYALLSLYSLLRQDLPENLRISLEKYLLNFKNICSFQTNYAMMRSYNSLLRYTIFKQKKDLWRSTLELKLVLSRQDNDGFFYDDPNLRSFQYHAYVLTLLYQYYQLRPLEKVRIAFLRGVDFLLPFVDQRGDFNYFGRGQKQVFGYVSYLYALRAAAVLTSNLFYATVAEKIEKYITPTLHRKEIVASPFQEQKIGWYAYNALSDYLPFAAYYLLLSKNLQLPYSSQRREVVFDYTAPFSRYYPGLELFLIRENNFLLCAGIAHKNSSEQPLIYHMYPLDFPTSGGPPFLLEFSAVSSQKDYSDIFIGVSFADKKEKMKEAVISSTGTSFIIRNTYPEFTATYTFSYSNTVKVLLTLVPRKKVIVIPLHFVSKKKPLSSLLLHLITSVKTLEGEYHIYESDPVELSSPMEFSFQFGKLEQDHAFPIFWYESGNQFSTLSYQFRKIFFFGVVLIGKIFAHPRDFWCMVRYYKERKKYY